MVFPYSRGRRRAVHHHSHHRWPPLLAEQPAHLQSSKWGRAASKLNLLSGTEPTRDLSASALRRVSRAPLINPVASYLPRYSGAPSYGELLAMQASKSRRRAVASSVSHGRKQRELPVGTSGTPLWSPRCFSHTVNLTSTAILRSNPVVATVVSLRTTLRINEHTTTPFGDEHLCNYFLNKDMNCIYLPLDKPTNTRL